MIQVFAKGVVVLTGLYLLFLGTASLAAPARAKRWLLFFASSRAVHFAEMFLRLLVGWALILSAPQTLFPDALAVVGWVLIVSSACLLVLPWQWHKRFAQQAVPRAARFIALIGIASLAMGGLVLLAVARA